MNSNNLGAFQVSQAVTQQFAEASGDFNPLHVDPVIARRYQFGSTVVHGVCGFFKALDLLLNHYQDCKSIASVKVQFTRPLRHGDTVDVECRNMNENKVKLLLSVSGKRIQVIDFVFAKCLESELSIQKNSVDLNIGTPQPKDLAFADVISLDAAFNLIWAPELIQSLFPLVKRYLPNHQIVVLLGLTNIVGMQCPGIDSIFAGFNIDFSHGESFCDPHMHFKIIKHDSRFSLITIGITHNTAKGEIEALFRPKFIQQSRYADLLAMVPKNIFAQQRALIIGGSRGAGEVTAKLIAAGGGQVIITYAHGQSDAERVTQDILSNGGRCDALRYNVLSPTTQITECFNGDGVSHIYYFASPLIEKSDQAVWNDAIFQKLYNVYLYGLASLIGLFLPVPTYRKNGITIFIPSTIFLDEPQQGFNEYIAAKAAVEAFAKQFSAKYKAWKFVVPRLPRMLTDQTSGVVTDKPMKTAEILLKVLMSKQ